MGEAPRRIVGGIVGAGIAVLVYRVALQNGYHVLALVAAGPGLGSGLAARRRSFAWGLVIAVVSVALTIVIEWLFLPLAADGSFGYFVTHLGDLPLKSKLSMMSAAVIGFYFGMGRNRKKEEERPA